MSRAPKRPSALVSAIVFAALPCVLGIGLAVALNTSGVIWLSDTGGIWPVFCLGLSLLAGLYLATTTDDDKILHGSAWLLLTWTWLYVPLWLTAPALPRTWALVARNGTVHVAADWAGPGTDTLWVLSGRTRTKTVRNVEGMIAANAVDVRYQFARPYIAARDANDDLSIAISAAVTAALAVESKKPRLARIMLVEKPEAAARFAADICSAVIKDVNPCPLKLTLTAQRMATVFGGLWSKQLSEAEAIEERHLPTLVQLLTQGDGRLVERDRVFALFLELASSADDLAQVARKPRMLDDHQLDLVIERIQTLPDAGSVALGLASHGTRLSQEQREALRSKAFREADLGVIMKQAGAGRVSDAELAHLMQRMGTAFESNPAVAVQALEVFGARLSRETQRQAVAAIAKGQPVHAIVALGHLNFSDELRAVLVKKVVTDAGLKELDANLSRERLDEVFKAAELRPLIESVLARSGAKDWQEFAVKVLPMRAMTADERKRLLEDVLFASPKAALEFVSENRQYLDAADVEAVTSDYVRTISRDLCLHLTHRNANRQIEYFSAGQIAIFERCAQGR